MYKQSLTQRSLTRLKINIFINNLVIEITNKVKQGETDVSFRRTTK